MNNAQESEHRRRQASEASGAPQQSKTKAAKGTRGWEDGKKLNTTRALARIKRIATCICVSNVYLCVCVYLSMHLCIDASASCCRILGSKGPQEFTYAHSISGLKSP